MRNQFFIFVVVIMALSAVVFSNVTSTQFVASPHGVNSEQLSGMQSRLSLSPHALAVSESKRPQQEAKRNAFSPHASYGISCGSVVYPYGLSGMAR